jgi:hypothetical protein
MESSGAMQWKIQSRLLILTPLGQTSSSPSPVPSWKCCTHSNHALSISGAPPFQISPRSRSLTSSSWSQMSRFGHCWSPRFRVSVTFTGQKIHAQTGCFSSKVCRLLAVVVRTTSTFARRRTRRSWTFAIGFAGVLPMPLDMRRSNVSLPNASNPTGRLTLRRRASLFSRYLRRLQLMDIVLPKQSSEPRPIGHGSSAFAVHVTNTAWLSWTLIWPFSISQLNHAKQTHKNMKTTKAIYGSFLSQQDAQQRAEALLHHVDAIGRIICGHGLNTLLGVSLLHKHFDLRDDEELVGGIQRGHWCSQPASVSPSTLVPMSWKLQYNEDIAPGWRAIEYFTPTADLVRKVEAADYVSRDSAFWADVSEYIASNSLQDTFGVALLDHTTMPLQPGFIWFEVSSESARRMVLCQVMQESTRAFSPGATVWDFSIGLPGSSAITTTAKVCHRGNSRCCCGDSAHAKAVLESVGSAAAELFAITD